MKSKAGRIASSLARWVIAVLGVAWVVSNLHWRDRVLFYNTGGLPYERSLLEPAGESDEAYLVQGDSGAETAIREEIINGPDRKTVVLNDGRIVPLLGMRLIGDINQNPTVENLIVGGPAARPGEKSAVIFPSDVAGGFKLDVPQPRVMTGIGTMLRKADSYKLMLALGVAPIPFFITTLRWQKLLAVLGIALTFTRAFVLNMVGAFYNTFMPGSTGGDVLKAYYAAKHAPDHRTGAVMSVVVDRLLGLIALVILGGTMAGYHWLIADDPHDPVTRACRRVAIGAAAIIVASLLGLAMLYTPVVRRQFTRSDRFVKSRAYQQLRKVMHVLHAYRSRPVLIVAAIVFTMPVHLTTVVSAMLAGQAFGLPLSAGYYFVIVPVIVLAGALPVSPQGVGVMEAFAYYFTRPQGASLNQALALTLSIRLVAVFWNLFGGLFVLRGGYHAPTQQEKQELADAPADSI